MTKELLRTENLSAGYGNNIILENINFSVHEKDFIAVIGPNGGGKTTLLKTILGLIPILSGRILFYKDNKAVKQQKIGYLPQYHAVDKRFPLRVFDVIHAGFVTNRLLKLKIAEKEKIAVLQVAEELGISDLLLSPIGKLSGGQLQKVFLGRAIVNQPDLLVLDEPNTYVDSKFEGDLYRLLTKLNSQMAILLVSHDLGTIFSHVKSIACVNRNLIYHRGNELSQEIIDTYNCPIDVVTHGHIPHRVLPAHQHQKN